MTSISVSAPSKFVVLGEHAVVYGEPAITLATDMRFSIRMSYSTEFTVNGRRKDPAQVSPHVKYLSRLHGDRPVSVFVDGRVPSGSGLGSSAALSAAFSAGLTALEEKDVDPETIAKEAYEAEYYAQGRGSPMDTSTAVHGYGIALNLPHRREDYLWTVRKKDKRWDVSKIDAPEMTFVIGNTGIRAATGPLVQKVERYRAESTFAYGVVEEIGEVVEEGAKAMSRNDVVDLGALMSYDQRLLSILGVSCPELDSLIDAVLPYSYGAKLTGSGGGGCMVALTDSPKKVAEAISEHGGTPYIVKTGVPGVTVRRKGERKSRPSRESEERRPVPHGGSSSGGNGTIPRGAPSTSHESARSPFSSIDRVISNSVSPPSL